MQPYSTDLRERAIASAVRVAAEEGEFCEISDPRHRSLTGTGAGAESLEN